MQLYEKALDQKGQEEGRPQSPLQFSDLTNWKITLTCIKDRKPNQAGKVLKFTDSDLSVSDAKLSQCEFSLGYIF